MNPAVLIVFLAPVAALLVVWAVLAVRRRNLRRRLAAEKASYDALVDEVRRSMPSRPPDPPAMRPSYLFPDPRGGALASAPPDGLDTPTHLRRERRRRQEERESTAGFLYRDDPLPAYTDPSTQPGDPMPALLEAQAAAWQGAGGSFSGGGASGGWDSPSPSCDAGSSACDAGSSSGGGDT